MPDVHEHFLDWTSDGSRIIFPHGKTIQAIDAEGTRPRLIADVNPVHELPYYFHADVLPVGSRIVYTTCRFPTDPPSWWWPSAQDADAPAHRIYDRTRRHYEIATANIDGSGTRRLTENIHLDHYPAWSPDGTRIAFISRPWIGEGGHLYTMAADGTDVQLLTPSLDTVGLYPPVWSPDGQSIALVGHESRSRRLLYTVGADGSDLTRISETLGVPSWSPDGSELAFPMGGEEAGVYASHLDGTGLRLITPAQASRVAWSPDGTEILFLIVKKTDRWHLEAGSVHVVNTDGSGLRTIDGPRSVNAAWSPDGSRIAMLGFDGDLPAPSRGFYNSSGSIATIARDGTDLRTLVTWEPSDDFYGGPGELVAGNPDPLGAPDETAPCAAGIVVPNPKLNTALVRDCEALLTLRNTFTDSVFLNWSADKPLTEWEGITVGGSPPRIRGVVLREYGLSGSIPPELGEFTALERLNLRWNSLRGSIPLELSGLTELRELRLDSNSLSGGFPPELSLLANLEVLNLRGNSLKGSIPREYGRLANLMTLSLGSNNELTGEIPPELGDLTKLERLYLEGGELTGAIPPELGRLTNLKTLDLWINRLTGSIPRNWATSPIWSG